MSRWAFDARVPVDMNVLPWQLSLRLLALGIGIPFGCMSYLLPDARHA